MPSPEPQWIVNADLCTLYCFVVDSLYISPSDRGPNDRLRRVKRGCIRHFSELNLLIGLFSLITALRGGALPKRLVRDGAGYACSTEIPCKVRAVGRTPYCTYRCSKVLPECFLHLYLPWWRWGNGCYARVRRVGERFRQQTFGRAIGEPHPKRGS